jgi:hypothetical protein
MLEVQRNNLISKTMESNEFKVPLFSSDLFHSKFKDIIYGLQKMIVKRIFWFLYGNG